MLTLPVTLGVLRCLVARVGDERYAVPVPGVVESLSLRDAQVPTLVVRHSSGAGGQLAWAVDRLEGESELVVKDLGPFLGRVPYVAGATIAGPAASSACSTCASWPSGRWARRAGCRRRPRRARAGPPRSRAPYAGLGCSSRRTR